MRKKERKKFCPWAIRPVGASYSVSIYFTPAFLFSLSYLFFFSTVSVFLQPSDASMFRCGLHHRTEQGFSHVGTSTRALFNWPPLLVMCGIASGPNFFCFLFSSPSWPGGGGGAIQAVVDASFIVPVLILNCWFYPKRVKYGISL